MTAPAPRRGSAPTAGRGKQAGAIGAAEELGLHLALAATMEEAALAGPTFGVHEAEQQPGQSHLCRCRPRPGTGRGCDTDGPAERSTMCRDARHRRVLSRHATERRDPGIQLKLDGSGPTGQTAAKLAHRRQPRRAVPAIRRRGSGLPVWRRRRSAVCSLQQRWQPPARCPSPGITGAYGASRLALCASDYSRCRSGRSEVGFAHHAAAMEGAGWSDAQDCVLSSSAQAMRPDRFVASDPQTMSFGSSGRNTLPSGNTRRRRSRCGRTTAGVRCVILPGGAGSGSDLQRGHGTEWRRRAAP